MRAHLYRVAFRACSRAGQTMTRAVIDNFHLVSGLSRTTKGDCYYPHSMLSKIKMVNRDREREEVRDGERSENLCMFMDVFSFVE